VLQWIRDNAILFGGVVTPTITGLFGLLVWWLNQKWPNKVRVREIDTVSFLDIAPSMRPRVVATFDGKPVQRLAQIEYSITSTCSDVLKDILLEVDFPNDTAILAADVDGVPANASVRKPDQITITIPFLNSYKHHHEIVIVKVLCDGKVSKTKVTGRGPGWSVSHTTAHRVVIVRAIVTLIVLLIAMVINFFTTTLGASVQHAFGVDYEASDWRTFLWHLPFYSLTVGLALFSFGWMYLGTRRFQRKPSSS
jgi:hypothetical protein